MKHSKVKELSATLLGMKTAAVVELVDKSDQDRLLHAWGILEEFEAQERSKRDGSWIYVEGNECPVEDDQLVEIKDEAGNQDRGKAGEFDWMIKEPGCAIAAYRVVED